MPLTSPPPSPFGVDWDRLTLNDLVDFLGTVPPPTESDLWEAKGRGIRKEHIHQAVSAFGNSLAGGYLVLGADQPTPGAPWTIDGWTFPQEAELWVWQVAGAIADCPGIDVLMWPVAGGRHVAVLAIEPAPIPPVITPSGCVFQRIGPSSQPVTSGAALRRVVEGGDTARDRARTASLEMQADVLGHGIEVPAGVSEPYVTVALGLASTGMPPDAADRIVSRGFVDAFRSAVLRSGHPVHPPIQIRTKGRTLFGWLGDETEDGFSIKVTPQAVGVAWRDPAESDAWWSVVKGGLLERVWGLADGLLQQLGGYGPAHLSVYVFRPANAQHLQIWTKVGALESDELQRIVDELRRGIGEVVIVPQASDATG